MPGKLAYRIRSLFWVSNRPFVHFFIKRTFNFELEAGSDAVPEPPFVVVANHANILDPWFIGYQFPTALFIMNNADAFRCNWLRRLYLEAIGTFPKKKGSHDYKAMKKTLQLLKDGCPVLIFPEGQTSWDGETQPVYSGFEKIIKHAKVSLVMIHIHGNFLSRPWWGCSSRRGRVGITIKVLRPDTLASMSGTDVLETVKKHIYNNDVKNPANRKVRFAGRDIVKGLERFVWVCPQCTAEDCLVSDGNTITCTACSASWEADAHLCFTPRMPGIAEIGDLHDWAAWHKEFVKARVRDASAGAVLTHNPGVILQTEGAGGEFVDRLTGTATLTSEKITFAPADSSGNILEWPLEKIDNYVIQLKDVFEFHTPEGDVRFVFDHHSPMKWIFYVRYLKGFEEIEARGHY